jgi:hypothetical protein
MDPDGNIYDMQGNFIGTANANELEETEEVLDGGNGQPQMNDGGPIIN